MIELDLHLQRGDFSLQAQLSSSSQVTGLMGPSGSGKTSLVLALAGVINPVKGWIRVRGKDFYNSERGINLQPEKRKLGVIFQHDLLFPHLSVRDNLLFGYRHTPQALRKLNPDEIFELLDLGLLLERATDRLSGGEARRVAVGRALLTSPCLLLLDEPLTGLDLNMRDRLLAYLLRLKKELSVPMIYVTHDFSSLAALADQTALLTVKPVEKNRRSARVAAFGQPFQVMAGLENDVFAGGIENIVRGEVIEVDPQRGYAVIRSEGLSLRTPLNNNYPGAESYITIRADDIILSVGSLPKMSARNIWKGKIEEIQNFPSTALVTVNIGPRIRAELTPEAVSELGLKPGTTVHALVKVKSLRSVVLAAK
ncbi:MAG TPA: molybdenum ABC transporter ATP-binding protein [archaeon]|nr:molybdenum ABC transporter ATP-binding protein [archaeon]